MDDLGFQERIRRDLAGREAARRILGAGEDSSQRELKRLWRRECIRHHPDRKPGAPEAAEKFKLVQRAYACLSRGEACEELASEMGTGRAGTSGGKYDTTNPWGYFLCWRERFF
jgi:DnaJ-class molecular chaperone